MLARRACILHHLGVRPCGFGFVGECVVVTCVCRKQAGTEPPAFSLSQFLGPWVPVGGDAHRLGGHSGLEAMAISLAASGTKVCFTQLLRSQPLTGTGGASQIVNYLNS